MRMAAQDNGSMSDSFVVGISDEPLEIGAALAFVTDPECGGVGLFVGIVRSEGAERTDASVVRLEYEAHPDLAESKLAEIAQAAMSKWDVRRISTFHRVGPCAVGEPTVVVAASAPHRAEALDACRWIIDSIKAEVPIWKREVYDDGSAWVGAGS
jgi:molybdopterin synthase catalytic subunit